MITRCSGAGITTTDARYDNSYRDNAKVGADDENRWEEKINK